MSPTKKLKIAIATAGRFHVLDLARELSALGHDVRFYSYVPKGRACRYGLPDKCHVSLLPYVAPLFFLERLLGRRTPRWVYRGINLIMDEVVSLMLEPCDVFIGMSGIYLKALRVARDKYHARVIVERGSRHILSQLEILSRLPGCLTPGQFEVTREMSAYEHADLVVIPAKHVRESFLERGFPPERLFQNPYGVNVSGFTPGRRTTVGQAPVAIFVGNWGQGKGADVVIAAVRAIKNLKLLHVGPLGDVAFPEEAQFVHHDPVDQLRLVDFYRQADISLLPSRAEGLALVQAQALASGLPLVCTDRTGGEDLMEMIEHPEAVISVERDNVPALKDGISRALEVARQLNGVDLLGQRGRLALSWAAYGKRYEERLAGLDGVKKDPMRVL